MSKDNMTRLDWLQCAADSVIEKMNFQMNSLGKTKDEAIEIVKRQTTAGSAAWEMALSQIA